MSKFNSRKKRLRPQKAPPGQRRSADAAMPFHGGSAAGADGRYDAAAEGRNEHGTSADAQVRASEADAADVLELDAEAWQMWSDLLDRATLPVDVGRIVSAAQREAPHNPSRVTRLRAPFAPRRSRRGWFLVALSTAFAVTVGVSVVWLLTDAPGLPDGQSPFPDRVALHTRGFQSPGDQLLHQPRQEGLDRSDLASRNHSSSYASPAEATRQAGIMQPDSPPPPWLDELDADLTALEECVYVGTTENVWSWEILSTYHNLEMLNQELIYETL